jgi:hypothetical protein
MSILVKHPGHLDSSVPPKAPTASNFATEIRQSRGLALDIRVYWTELRLGAIAIGLAARMGLSALLTFGFANALMLYGGLESEDPLLLRASVAFFGWFLLILHAPRDGEVRSEGAKETGTEFAAAEPRKGTGENKSVCATNDAGAKRAQQACE